MKKMISLAIVLVMILGSSALPGRQASAAVVWQEDFEDPDALDDWNLFGATNMTGEVVQTNESGFSIVDGALTAPNSTSFDTASIAVHDSTVAYGTWRFKWYAAEESYRGAYDNLWFLFNYPDEFNFTGLTQNEVLTNVSGYTLLMVSAYTPAPAGVEAPGLNLCKLTKNETSPFEILASHGITPSSEPITGWHDIIITRNQQGEFNVSYDSKLVIQATDTFTTTSEYFLFGSFTGDSRIDNITVSDIVDIIPTATSTTTGAEGYLLWLVIPAMGVLVLMQKKKKL